MDCVIRLTSVLAVEIKHASIIHTPRWKHIVTVNTRDQPGLQIPNYSNILCRTITFPYHELRACGVSILTSVLRLNVSYIRFI